MRLAGKNKTFILLIIALTFLLSGCLDSGNGIKTRISGSFPSFKGKSVSISEIDINKAIPLDTVKISDDGSFTFKFRRPGPGFYLIKVDNKNYITLVLDQEKRISVSSDQSSLRKDYEVEGSPDSQLYRDFEMFLEANRQKVDSLTRTYSDFQRSATFQSKKLELDKTYQEIFEFQRQYAIKFLENHCSSLASLLVINRRFGERKVLNEKDDFSYFTMIDSCLAAKYPDNKHLAEHKKRIEAAMEEQKKNEMTEMRIAVGQKVPAISLQNPSGKDIPLYTLAGRPVIIYFWASWDNGSRKANATLKELLGKVPGVRPDVYAIGLESYKEPWQDAIRIDGIQNWTNVTDYLNIYSSAKSLFSVPDGLPYFILLDKDLKIRYKGNNFAELASEINNKGK
jgi:thiol-disulfide isomerase/thioredoxin